VKYDYNKKKEVEEEHHRRMGLLSVTLINGVQLLPKQYEGYSQIYCILQVGKECLTSKPINSVNPEWNSQFLFTVTKPEKETLEILVVDVCCILSTM
jgi:Ca2+-dependent lipid-binding protein